MCRTASLHATKTNSRMKTAITSRAETSVTPNRENATATGKRAGYPVVAENAPLSNFPGATCSCACGPCKAAFIATWIKCPSSVHIGGLSVRREGERKISRVAATRVASKTILFFLHDGIILGREQTLPLYI